MPKRKGLTWADVTVGQDVDMGGKPWRVTSHKIKGATVKVTVTGASASYDRKVNTSDPVKLWAMPTAPAEKVTTKGKLHEKSDTGDQVQRRWAKDHEGYDAPEKLRDGKGWAKPRGAAEKVLAAHGAVLLGDTKDESRGYYVPVVDPSTIAAHLYLFHGKTPGNMSYEEMTVAHMADHGLGHPIVNHTHSKVRP